MNAKKFRLILFSGLMIALLLFSGTAYAQGEELPNPGITPDSPFYFLDKLNKNISLFVTIGHEAKARKALEYSEERLAEAQTMATKNKPKSVEQAAIEYDRFVSIATERQEQARLQGAPDNISESLALATSKHIPVLDGIKDRVPAEAAGAIIKAREVSIKGRENALKALARTKPERAIQINLVAIRERLDRAGVKADQGNTEEVEEAIAEAEKLREFEEEVSTIAQRLGRDTTEIEQLVAQETSNRLQVLSRVYEKVPEQAKPAIERAITNSVRQHERKVEALKSKGALRAIPEKVAVPRRVLEKDRARLSQSESTTTEDTKDEAAANIKEPQRADGTGDKAGQSAQSKPTTAEDTKDEATANTKEPQRADGTGDKAGQSAQSKPTTAEDTKDEAAANIKELQRTAGTREK